MGKRARKNGRRSAKRDPYKYAFNSDRATAKDVAAEKGDLLKSAMYNTPSGGYNYDRLGSGRQAADAYNQQVNQYAKDKSQQVTAQNQYDKLRTPSQDFGKLGNKARRQKVKQQNQQGVVRPEVTAVAPQQQAYQPAPAYNSAARSMGGPRSMDSRMANLRNKSGRSRSPASQSQEQAPAAGTVAQGQIKS